MHGPGRHPLLRVCACRKPHLEMSRSRAHAARPRPTRRTPLDIHCALRRPARRPSPQAHLRSVTQAEMEAWSPEGSCLVYSCGQTNRHDLGGCRQAHAKRRSPAADVVVAENLSAVFLHNAVADAETQAGTLPNFLGCKEGVEDPVWMRDAIAVVRK